MQHIKYYMLFALCISMQWASAQTGGVNPYQKKLNPGGTTYLPFIPPQNPINPGETPILPTGEEERRVFWFHGLNGTTGSWSSAAHASQYGVNPAQGLTFTGRKLESKSNLTYTQDKDIWVAGGQLYNSIDLYRRGPALDTMNFVIAHSQGGVVSRAMTFNRACGDGDSFSEMPYGGIVTFATSHGGAQILNNKAMFEKMAEESCKDLLAGPIAKAIYDDDDLILLFYGLKVFGEVDSITDLVCEGLTSVVYDLGVNIAAPIITDSYKVGARDIDSLNTTTCESDVDNRMHKMAFYGVENPDGLMFRTNKYFLKSPNSLPYFDANEDQDAVDDHMARRSRFLAEKQRYQRTLKILKKQRRNCFLLLSPPAIQICLWLKTQRIDACNAAIRGYDRGVRWHDRVDDQYKTAIGALTFQTIVEPGWCRCWGKYHDREFKIDNNNPCEPDYSDDEIDCHTMNKVTVKRIYKDNDGVVLAESATAFPGATVDQDAMNVSSHMQLRNNEELRNRLDRLYDGEFGDFFYTDKR